VYFDAEGFDQYPILGFAKRATDYYPRKANAQGGWGGRAGASKDGTVKVALVNAGASALLPLSSASLSSSLSSRLLVGGLGNPCPPPLR
jgi:hypothetical protein